MSIIPKLLALIPVAQTILWAMLVFAVWTCRDLITARLARTREIAAPRPRLRWKLAVLSSLAATELVLCLVGVMSA